MNSYYVFAAITLVTTVLPCITGGFRLKMLDLPSRIFYALMVLAFITEVLAYYAAVKYHNNMPVYNISNLLHIFLIALYFNYTTSLLRRRYIGWYVGVFSILAGILNMVFAEPVTIYNSNFFIYETVLVIALAMLFLFTDLMLTIYHYQIRYSPHFWFILLMVTFYVFNFTNMSLYNYFTDNMEGDKYIIDISIFSLNGLINTGFALVFLLYPKMKIRYA